MIFIALRKNRRDIEFRITISLQDNNWSIAVRCLVKCCLWVEELALDKLHRGYWNVFSPVWRSARRKKRQKLVIFFWMFGHVSFESIGPATWVTALWALKWFFSSVNAEVAFQMSCFAEWAPALFTVMWLLSRVGEQMSVKVSFCDRRKVAPFALIWLF